MFQPLAPWQPWSLVRHWWDRDGDVMKIDEHCHLIMYHLYPFILSYDELCMFNGFDGIW